MSSKTGLAMAELAVVAGYTPIALLYIHTYSLKHFKTKIYSIINISNDMILDDEMRCFVFKNTKC